MKDFAFALIVGITSGAYSSIFIAAPLLTIWKEREPEYAKRKRLAGGVTRSRSTGAGVRISRCGQSALVESEQALSAESTPELVDVIQASPSEPGAQARREKRRQRRRTRAAWPRG